LHWRVAGRAISRKTQFQIGIGPPPQKRDSRCPILEIDNLTSVRMGFRRKNAGRCRELRPCDFSPNRAGSDSNLGIISDALLLARKGPCHHIKFVTIFSKPHRSCDLGSVRAKRGQRNVFLAVDGGRDLAGHSTLAKRSTICSLARHKRHGAKIAGKAPTVNNGAETSRMIAPASLSVLQA
jgi:hypothetical protein